MRGAEPFECTLEYDGRTETVFAVQVSVSNTPIFGGMFGFRAAEFFKLDAAEAAAVQKAPQVKF